jgi:hypothetical protein
MNTLNPFGSKLLKRIGGLLVGFLWALISVFIFAYLLTDLLKDLEHDGSTIVLALIAFLSIAGGLVMIGEIVVPWIADMRVSKPDVAISVESIRLGEAFTFRYSQTFKQRTGMKGAKLSLILRERVIDPLGTRTTLEGRKRVWEWRGERIRIVDREETVEEREFPAQVYDSGDPFSFLCEFTIPRTSMHTFRSPHNRIAWLLRMKADFSGWPDYMQDFDIQVQPSFVR